MADIQDTPERSERDAPIRAHIANVGDMAAMFLNMDRLRDREFMHLWHPFPTTAEKLQDALAAISAEESRRPVFSIIDYETDIPGLRDRLPYDADVDELNYLAVKLAGMDDFQLQKFCAAMEYSVLREGLTDIINTAENLDCFELQPAFDAEQYGEFLIEAEQDNTLAIYNRLEQSADPEERAFAQYIVRLEKNVDAAAYGRAAAEQEKGVFTGHGYLTKESALEDIYTDSHDIPTEYRVSASPEREPRERPSVMDKLAAAKEKAGKLNAEKSDKPQKSHDAEL